MRKRNVNNSLIISRKTKNQLQNKSKGFIYKQTKLPIELIASWEGWY